jgi:hypothetical protein
MVATMGVDCAAAAAAAARSRRNSAADGPVEEDWAPAVAGAVGRGPGASAAGADVESSAALRRGALGVGYQAETEARFP